MNDHRNPGRWRRTTVEPGTQVPVSFAADRGLRVIGAVSGAVRARRRLPFGTRAVLLNDGEVLCASAHEVSGFFENLTDEPAMVVDAVLDVDVTLVRDLLGPPDDGAASTDDRDPRTSHRFPPPIIVRACSVTTAVFRAATAPGAVQNDDYQQHAGRYLAAHLAELLATRHDGRQDDTDHGVETEFDESFPGGHEPEQARIEGGVQAFSLDQRVVLLETMRARMGDRVRVQELADVVGYSQYHFLRRFQVTFGLTPYQYLTDMRVAAACRWLEDPVPRPLQWIALQCGFTRTESFVRAFRQRVGTTPSRYAAGDRTGPTPSTHPVR